MGKKSGAAAQRAKKKNEKEQKRKKAVAQKRQAMAARAPRPVLRRETPTEWRAEAEGIAGLAAQIHVPFYEAAHMAARFAGASWTEAKVAALETGALVDRLAQLGVSTDRDAFVAATQRLDSAVGYAQEAWLPLLAATSDVQARDFACLAACELWKRWRPEPPSQEMLLDALLLGQDLAQRGDETAATEQWLRFWSLLKPRITPEMRTTHAVDALLGDGGSFFNWASDFAMAAQNARDPQVMPRAAEALAEILAQLSAESDDWRLPLLRDRARMLYAMGERDEAERLLREQIAAHPDLAGGYVTLADLWEDEGGELRRALTVLEEAAARPVTDGEDWDLEGRRDVLRERLAKAEKGAQGTKR